MNKYFEKDQLQRARCPCGYFTIGKPRQADALLKLHLKLKKCKYRRINNNFIRAKKNSIRHDFLNSSPSKYSANKPNTSDREYVK